MNKLIKTTCPYCGVGCGIDAQVDEPSRQVIIRGDNSHPANFGRLCSKGSALADTLELKSRLLNPQIQGKEVTWEIALDWVANALLDTIAKYGPNAVAIYGSGQLLTEDYYVANKLMKGFIGSGNMDTNSRLCMSSSVTGHKRAFGSDTVPGCYEDLELADMIVLIGSNAAWCHPVSFQRIRAAKTANPDLKVIVIDPRKTDTCDLADLHLAIAPGSDALLFNGLLHYLSQHDALDLDFIAHYTEGSVEAFNKAAEVGDLSKIAIACRVAEADLLRFYRWFAQYEKTISLYSQGVNQSSSGTDKVNAIINCHLATGRIGKPGMGPFSLTGQPNAMGGREVGGLANQLAAHMDYTNAIDIDRVARFWQSKVIADQPGYPAVELFDAIYDGNVKAVWIMGTNPVVSLPDADKVKQALQRCDLVVVSDCIADTDTTALAHVLFPALGWSEKEGTVTNSERRISRQRALFKPAGNAKPDWWIMTQIARRMGFEQAFNYQSAADIFREHAALSGFENDHQHGLRDFDLSGLAEINDQAYEQLQPIQWPVNKDYPNGRARMFDDKQFFTASAKAQFIAITPRMPVNQPNQQYPLILNTGRLRDQWHTMTRTALAANLNQHKPEPFVEVHPADVAKYALSPNGLALIESQWGTMLARIQMTHNQQQGNLFVPMHWTAQWASCGRMGVLVNPVVDPLSKQPESKHTPVRIQAYQPVWQGFVLSRRALKISEPRYWVKIKGAHYYRYELAGETLPDNWQTWARNKLSDAEDHDVNWQEYHDSGAGQYRAARFIGNNLESLLFIAPLHTQLPERSWLTSLFEKTAIERQERTALLTGLPPPGVLDVGAIVCACFNVGQKTIQNVIKEKGLTTVQQVGQCSQAGTNCGSCVPEIKAILGAGSLR